MASTKTISVGTYGQWRAAVAIIDEGADWHKVRVTGTLINNGTSTSYNNNGVTVFVSGSNSWSGTSAFSVPGNGGEDTIINRTFTITHTSAKTVTYDVGFGPTGTGTFGTGSETTVDITLPTLATKPDAPSTPSISAINNSSVTLDINDPGDNGGSAITKREIGIGTSTSSANATWYTANSSGTYTKGSLTAGGKYYAWGRVTNAIGTSSVSGRRDIQIHDVPDTPGQPSVSSVTNASAVVTFSDGAWNGGSSITDRSIYWNTTNNTATATRVSGFGNSGTLSGLPAGSVIYIWPRVSNTYGPSSYGPVQSFTTHNVPSAPAQPSVTNITQTTAALSFTDGATNGSSITERRLYWNTTNSTTGAVSVLSDGSDTLSGLPPGDTVYVWARTKNAYGWSAYSAVRSFKLIAGAYVNVGGVWKPAVPYQKVNGVWVLLEPRVRSNGIWQGVG